MTSKFFFFELMINMKLIMVAMLLLFVGVVLCVGRSGTLYEHFADKERPSDVERARRIRKRIERRQHRQEERRSRMFGYGYGYPYAGPGGSVYGGGPYSGIGGPVAGPGAMFAPGPYAPGPYGRRTAPGFYEPEVDYALRKGSAPRYFSPDDDFVSKDITKVLSNCSARFNPNCRTIVHDTNTGKVYRYRRPSRSMKNKSGVNTYTLV